jgi:hypothetical protein
MNDSNTNTTVKEAVPGSRRSTIPMRTNMFRNGSSARLAMQAQQDVSRGE